MNFQLINKIDKKREGIIKTLHGKIHTPAFGPDATRGLIKYLSPTETLNLSGVSQVNPERFESSEIQFLLTNTYHMVSFPGDEFIKEMGGVHKFMKWPLPILTDSGGFQAFSLIHRINNGKVTDEGAFFRNPKSGERLELTPQKAIDIQFNLGSDIMVVLDDCRHYKDTRELKKSVYRTIEWAKICKEQFTQNIKKYYGIEDLESNYNRPQLFAVVQGGIDFSLRKYCAEELVKIGFDGYGFGGWAINEKEYFPYDLLEYVADILPEDKPRYAMGVGTPQNITKCIEYGYDLFDCVIPTRNGRHGLCYTSEGEVKIFNQRYKTDSTILDDNIKSIASEYERYYLHHLFKIQDPLGGRLLSIHNLKYFNWIIREQFR